MAKDLPTLTTSSTNPFGRAPRRRRKKEPPVPATALTCIQSFLMHWRTALNWSRVALTLATILLLSALLSLHLLPDKVSLRAGDTSSQEIRALHTVRYLDQDQTLALREAAAARVDPVYAPVLYAAPEADQTVSDAYALLRRERLLSNQNPMRAAEELRQQVGIIVSPPSLLAPLLRDTGGTYHVDQAERLTHQVVHDAMEGDIHTDRPTDLAGARAVVAARISASMLPREDVPAVAALARAVLRPNRELDEKATLKARQREEALVAPAVSTIFAGDIVVRRNQTVTPAVISKLQALGLQNPRLDPGMVASVTLLVALMVGVVAIYLARYHPPVYGSVKTLSLLSLLVVLSVLGLKLGDTMLGARLPGTQFGYIGMLCVASVGMLIAALIHPRVAMLVTALLAVQSGLILGNDLRFSTMTLLSSCVAIYAVSDIRSRNDVLRAGALLCITNILLGAVMGRIEGDAGAELGQSVQWAGVTGILSVAIFSLGVALFERPFGITTHLGLLELSDPNRTLLQRFCQLAPGTYTHSIMVGNLAVAAAEAIGADALLCRVGALYHDLGKMRRAEFFIENQSGDNIHERLNPSLSALVVTAHVRDGLEIAEDEKLPPIIKAFITEHHGTSLIRYFYHQQTGGHAAEAAPGLEQHFRYAGPKPQSRETAILMLADGVEAASRTLEKPTPGRISDLVDAIIQAQLADGQLDECEITLHDLRGIRDAFVRLLTGMLHSRIEYPAMLKSGDAKVDKNESIDKSAHGLVPLTACAEDSDTAPAGSAAA